MEDGVLIDRYVDEGESGTPMEGRLESVGMLRDIENDKSDIILVKRIDRGWRTLVDERYSRISAYCRHLFLENKIIICNFQ